MDGAVPPPRRGGREYLDLYHRRRTASPTSTGYGGMAPAGGVSPPTGDASDREPVGAADAGLLLGRVQRLEMRAEDLAARLSTFDDKIVNLTKLVKLSQTLQEERDASLEKEVHELKMRLRRQEQLGAQAEEQVAHLRQTMDAAIRGAVAEALEAQRAEQLPVTRQLEQHVRDLDGVFESIAALARGTARGTVAARDGSGSTESTPWGHLLIDGIHALTHAAARDAVQEHTRRVESGLDTAAQQSSTAVRAVEDRLEGVVANAAHLRGEVSTLAERVDRATTELSALAGSITAAVAQAREGEAQSRRSASEGLEDVKQWMTRNIQRLKKHIDVVGDEVEGLGRAQAEAAKQLRAVGCAAQSERQRLLALVHQKSREAEVLSSIIEKEIGAARELVERHGPAAPPPTEREPRHPPGLFDDLAFTPPSGPAA